MNQARVVYTPDKPGQSPDDMLCGLKDSRHVENVTEIWNHLLGIARVGPQFVEQKARDINSVARDIMFAESERMRPSSLSDRTEISHLFRHAAAMITASTQDPDVITNFVAPLLDRARDIGRGK